MFSFTAPVGESRLVDGPTTRHSVALAIAASFLIAGTQTAAAQNPTKIATPSEQTATGQSSKWEFLVASGTAAPLGTQRQVFDRADLTAIQLSYVIRPELAVTTAVSWVRSHDIAAPGEPRLDIFTYDVGAEFRGPIKTSSGTLGFRPFAGIGAGGRSYKSHGFDIDPTHSVAAYIGAGGEVSVRRTRVRLEIRDYISHFNQITGEGSSGARSDVVAMLGLRFAGK